MNVGIIILSPGIKNRVAPHRLYVKMARRFCELGFNVLRFDPEGLGDSEGEINEVFTANLYGLIQVGRFIEDTACAMDWMEKECGISRFILAGLCGGAITGLLTGARDRRVVSLLGLGIPVILDSIRVDIKKYMTKTQLENIGNRYLGKLFHIEAWKRFLLLRSDYHLIYLSIFNKIKGKVINSEKASSNAMNFSQADNQAGNNFNTLFPVALQNMLKSRKMVLIFSGVDRLYWEFEDKYLHNYEKEFSKLSKNLRIHVIKNANHILSFKEWQDEMINKTTSALRDIVSFGESIVD
jgi:pimeloyl-ACP methyl ester carboxylesterase